MLLNENPAVPLTAKVKSPCKWRLKELERKRDIQRESWDPSAVGEVKVS